MSGLEASKWTASVSQIRPLPPDACRAMAEEIKSAQIPYKALYDDFQSGGWYTAALYSPPAAEGSGIVRDGVPKPTELASRLPITRRVLEGLGLDFCTARIARMNPDSYLWEHRDHLELDSEKSRLRLHVPLITNPAAVVHFPGWKVHMACGWLWKLDPTVRHAASNVGVEPRTHLVLDCYINETLFELLGHEVLDTQFVQRQPRLGPSTRRERLDQAYERLQREGCQQAETSLLKLFHQFDLGDESSYDIITSFYSDIGFHTRENYWIQEQIARVYSREKVDPDAAMPDVRETVLSEPHVSTRGLPQHRILEQVLTTLQHLPGLEEAYVRGSLARGNADLHSDIDLHCEVLPQHFISFIEQATNGIRKGHNAIADGLVDTIAKDFGGTGFIYLLEASGRLVQLDLYITCKGRPWGSDTFRREIFRRVNRGDDVEKHENLLYRLHATSVDQEVQRIRNVEPSVEHTLLELNVLSFMLKKYLERDDEFMASSEYHLWKTCFVKIVRQKFDTQYRDYGLYHLKRLATAVGDDGKLFEDLRAIFSCPLTPENFLTVHRYAIRFAQKHFPEQSLSQQKLIDAVLRHFGGSEAEVRSTTLTSWSQKRLRLSF